MKLRRRSWLLGALPLASCASDTAAPGAVADHSRAAAPVRSLAGGFLASAVAAPGQLPRPGSGMYVKLQAPTALALRGFDLLVADAATGRLWRADLMMQTLSGVAGASVSLRGR